MRTLFIITCLANIAFAFGTLPWMPDRVTYDFVANKSVSPIIYAVFASTLIGVLGTVFFGLSLIPFTPATSYGTPNRDYWLKEENRPKANQHTRSYFESGGFGTMLLFLSWQWAIFQANQRVPAELNKIALGLGAGIFVVFIIVILIRFCLAFRLPKGKE